MPKFDTSLKENENDNESKFYDGKHQKYAKKGSRSKFYAEKHQKICQKSI